MPTPENLSEPRTQASSRQASPRQASPKQASPKQVSIERGGLGQSGYTAGREEGDLSLEDVVDTRYVAPPGSSSNGLGLDDRFTGRGGPVSDIERDRPGEALAQPYPSANGAPDPASSEPDGASGRWDGGGEDPLDRSELADRAGDRSDD